MWSKAGSKTYLKQGVAIGKIYFILLLISIIILISFSAKTNITGKFFQLEVVENNGIPISVYFCKNEDCENYLMKTLGSANKSIHCALHDLDSNGIEEILGNEKTENKLVIDKQNVGKIGKLHFVTNYGTQQLMHNKFCVVDNYVVITGSFNPTEKSSLRDDNNMIIVHSRYIGENYENEFKELWDRNFGEGGGVKYPIIYLNNIKIENYFCPEDSCEDHILKSIGDSKTSIYFLTFTFTSDNIGNKIIEKYMGGVDVKGVFEKFQVNNFSEFNKFKSMNMPVKTDNNKYFMHNKVFIIDNETVITGSFNPTKSANERNDENILIIYDTAIANKYLAEFNRIWG